MFGQVIGSIFSTAKEKLIDNGLEVIRGRINSSSSSENVERNFKSLMARANDLENDIYNQVQQQGTKRKREEVRVWFQDVKKVKREYCRFKKEEKSKGIVKKIIFGGDEAVQMNARIRDLDDRSRVFGELVVGDDSIRGLPRPTSGLEGEAIHENFQRIWNLLENDEAVSIGVHGMGGVGKSTLVEHINNQLLERKECVYWVVVSQRCSIKVLQDKIACKLRLELSDEGDDEGARAGKLKHALSQRGKLVLILDDVWEHIDLVKVGLPLSAEGCKWVMTSRSLKVCQEMNCQAKIVVHPLSKAEGWNLFLKNLGQDATSSLRDPEVEGIAKRVVKICDGLPLGIITLAGAMSGVTGIQEWRHALTVLTESGMGHEWMEEKVFPVLKYSFDRLNRNDQIFFLYCSLYPEDHRISKEEWFTTFITEDLVDKTKSRAAQSDEAHSVVTKLVKVSLLESVSDSFKGERVKMHDLVRAMAHKITRGKTMVIAGHYSNRKEIPIEEEWTKDLEKVSLMMNGIDEIPLGISPNCPKLSTLLLRGNPLREGISTSFFSNMCGLRTLDLSQTHIRELPDSVSDLMNLTSLLLGRCRKLVHVPCVRKLKALRELDLSHTSIEDVPIGMQELVNIRCLSMNEACKLSRTSLELKSPWLQVLRLPLYVEAKLVEGYERLEVFEGWLKHMSHFHKFAASKLDGVSYLILVSDSGDRYLYFGSYTDGKRKLIVSDYKLKERKEKELPILAECIQHLQFKFCKGMSKCLLDDLTNPTSLQELNVSYCKGIECMLTYDQYKAPQHQLKSRFQAVEVIELKDLPDFMGVIYKMEVEAAAPLSPLSVLSSLRKLTISKCNKVKKLGLPLCVYENLEYISIEKCEELEEIIQVAAAEDDGSLLISLPNLKYLRLVGLPSLESFCDAPVICNSIETVECKDCPILEEPSLNRGTTDSYKPLFGGISSSSVKKEWWEIDLFRHWSR